MKKDQYSVARIIQKAMPLCWQVMPAFQLATNLLAIVHAVTWALGTIVTQNFFDWVTRAVAGEAAIGAVIGALALMGGITILQQVLNGICNFMIGRYFEQSAAHMRLKLARKAARLDPVEYESPEILDDINKASEGAQNVVNLVFSVVSLFTFYMPYFVTMAVYLYRQKPILAFSIVLVFIPVMLTQLIRTAVFAQLEEKAAPLRRQYEYYEKTMTDREFFKETRLLGGFGYLYRQYKDALKLLNKETWKADKRTTAWELFMRLLTLAGYMGILVMLYQALMNGEISVGTFAAVFSSVGMLFGVMEEIICMHIGGVAKSLGTVRNYMRFMDAKERVGSDEPMAKDADIELKAASFHYPGAEKNALTNIDLHIKRGETLAIVGENGAGKTTLVRLITGIFLPTEGDVTIGARSTADASIRSIYQGISAVFQKFQRYRLTLKENVSISDRLSGVPIAEAIGQAGFSAGDPSFPDGEETVLSREFDGVDLSGGQWQRVAIARGFYRAHGMIVLDEPTAAIDPLEETRVYHQFAEISKDVTAVIVTHRMGSARIADRIVVMDDGKIAEIGTHDELMAKKGRYAAMVEAQAGWYE